MIPQLFYHSLIFQTAAKFTAGGLGDIGSAMKDGMMNLGSETKDLFGFVSPTFCLRFLARAQCSANMCLLFMKVPLFIQRRSPPFWWPIFSFSLQVCLQVR